MSHAVLLWNNRSPAAVWTASSAKTSLPASFLGTEDLAETWQSAEGVDAAVLLADAGAAVPVGAVVLLDLAGTDAATLRVRLSTADPTGAAGDAFDSGTVSGFAPMWRHWPVLLPADVAARYLRIDLAEAGAPRLELGGIGFGPTWRPEANFERGWGWGQDAADSVTQAWSGREWIAEGAAPRVLRLRLPAVTPEEMAAQVRPAVRQVRGSRPVLALRDPDAAPLGAEAVWGPNRAFRDRVEFPEVSHQRFRVDFEIAEMLR